MASDSLENKVEVSQMERERKGFLGPENEVIVLVVNQGRNTTVRVIFSELWLLLITGLEIEVDRLVREAEFLEYKGNLPARVVSYLRHERKACDKTCHPLGPPAWV